MRPESLEFLRAICDAPSPSGYEQPAARVYRERASAYADLVETDSHGNTWAALNPDAPQRIMLSGHMDEIGFQILHVSDEGLLYFAGIGGHDSMVPVGQRVWVHGKERVAGVVGRKPIHLLEGDEKEKRPQLHDLWIDIGAKDKAEAESVVSVGDCATYQWEFAPLLGGRAAARGFDNKMGAFIVAEALRLLKEEGGLDPGVGVFAVATVQEEIGLRGATTAAYALAPKSGLAVDVDFAIDTPGLSKSRYGDAAMGKGPTVTKGANINPVVLGLLLQAAQEDGIPYQLTAEPRGTGTDANAMQLSRGGVATGLVGVPIRYMHSPGEVLELSDVEHCARLMAGYCRRVRPETSFVPL